MLAYLTIIEVCILALINQLKLINIGGFAPVIVLVFTALYVMVLPYDPRLRGVNSQIVLGLLLRIALLFFDVYCKDIYNLPNSGPDANWFYRTSLLVAQNKNVDDAGLFSLLMGTLMRFLGTNRLIAQFIIVMFSLFSLVFIAYSLYEMNLDCLIQKRVMTIVSLLPNFAILGSIFLRESIVTLFVAMSCYSFTLWIKRKSEVHFLLSLIFVLLSAIFHSGTLGIAIGYLLVRYLYDKENEVFRLRLMNIVISTVFLLVFTYFFLMYKDTLFGKLANVISLEDIANTHQEGGSSYAKYVGNSNSISNMLKYTPLRILYFLFSPFPWQWRGMADIIAFLFSSLFYFHVVYSAIIKVKMENAESVLSIIWLIIAFSVIFVFAWGVSNTGTAARHRDKLVPIFSIMWACSIHKLRFKETETHHYIYIKDI